MKLMRILTALLLLSVMPALTWAQHADHAPVATPGQTALDNATGTAADAPAAHDNPDHGMSPMPLVEQGEQGNAARLEGLWSIAVFAIFFAVLSFLVWPKILKALKARETKIHGDLEKAEHAAAEASRTLAEYQKQLAEAQAQARKIVEESRADARRIGEQIKEETQKEIDSMRKRAQHEITGAKEEALAEIYAKAGALATEVASKIIRREITVNDQDQLVSATLAEMSGKN